MGEWYFYQVAVQDERGNGNFVVTDHFVVAARSLEEADKTASEVEKWFVWVNPDAWRVSEEVAAKHSANWPGEVPASVMKELGDAAQDIPQRTDNLNVRGRIFPVTGLQRRITPSGVIGCLVVAVLLILAALALVWFFVFRPG